MAAAGKKSATDKSTTSTDTNVNLTTPLEAKQTLASVFADKLGRRPSDQEISAFTAALNAYESSNPATSTTTTDTQTDPLGNQTIKSQNTTGTDKGTGDASFVNDYATNYLQQNNAAEVQGVQNLGFWNIAMRVLGGSGAVSTENPT